MQILVMARYRGMNMAVRPIQRIKHVVDSSATQAGAAQVDYAIAKSSDTPVLANTTECITGSKINGIYLRVEVASTETDAGAIPNVYMAFWKDPAGSISAPNVAAVGPDDNKRFVIHQEMAMVNNFAGGTPRTLFNGVIVIPKGMRRMGPNDIWNCSIKSPALNIAVCMQAHYKEFR